MFPSFEALSHSLRTRCLRFAAFLPHSRLYNHARLASGWRPAFAARDWLPAGSHREVSARSSTWHPPHPGFAWRKLDQGLVDCYTPVPQVNEVFEFPVASDERYVDIRIVAEGWLHTMTIDLLVDNQTGEWWGTTNSPDNCHGFPEVMTTMRLCWEVEHTGLPEPLLGTVLCGTWNATFIDQGFGEDEVGTAYSVEGTSRYSARSALFGWEAEGPIAHWANAGWLARDGCTEANPYLFVHVAGASIDDGGLEFSMVIESTLHDFWQDRDVEYRIRNTLGNPQVVTLQDMNPPPDQWPRHGVWAVPPERSGRR